MNFSILHLMGADLNFSILHLMGAVLNFAILHLMVAVLNFAILHLMGAENGKKGFAGKFTRLPAETTLQSLFLFSHISFKVMALRFRFSFTAHPFKRGCFFRVRP